MIMISRRRGLEKEREREQIGKIRKEVSLKKEKELSVRYWAGSYSKREE